jgi:hypothetical protein
MSVTGVIFRIETLDLLATAAASRRKKAVVFSVGLYKKQLHERFSSI